MILNEQQNRPYLTSMASCLNRIVTEGYTEDFRITEKGLESVQHQRVYLPDEVELVSFFRFEGASEPESNVILYVIQTRDGIRGTLIDTADGPHSDNLITRFMKTLTHDSQKAVKN